MKEYVAIVKRIWSVCLDKSIRFVAGEESKEERSKNVKNSLDDFLKHWFEYSVDVLKEGLPDECFSPSL